VDENKTCPKPPLQSKLLYTLILLSANIDGAYVSVLTFCHLAELRIHMKNNNKIIKRSKFL